jgi:hypothetical protein
VQAGDITEKIFKKFEVLLERPFEIRWLESFRRKFAEKHEQISYGKAVRFFSVGRALDRHIHKKRTRDAPASSAQRVPCVHCVRLISRCGPVRKKRRQELLKLLRAY